VLEARGISEFDHLDTLALNLGTDIQHFVIADGCGIVTELVM
jgi:hypothetical protein